MRHARHLAFGRQRDNSGRAGRAPVRMVSAGLHSFLRISKQMAPLSLLMFGCQMRVSNFICTRHRRRAAHRIVARRVKGVRVITFGGTNG